MIQVDLCTENNAAVSNEPVPSRNKKQKSIISYFVREGPHVGCPYYTAKVGRHSLSPSVP